MSEEVKYVNKKVKRIDENLESTASSDPDLPVANPVVSMAGTVYVMDRDDAATLVEDLKDKKQVVATKNVKTDRGIYSAPPEDKMEEVSYQDYMKSKEVDLTSPSKAQSTIDKLRDLIGKTADVAQVVLEELKNKKALANYRFIPIGGIATMELQPGRVQLLVDHQKKIVDVNIS